MHKHTHIHINTYTFAYACSHSKYTYIYTLLNLHICVHVICICIIAVAQLSINGTTVDSVTDRDNEPQYHVKEDAGSITLCIRVESFPEEKDNLTIDYLTLQRTACKLCNT